MKDVKALLNLRNGDDDGFQFGDESIEELWEKAFAEAADDFKFDPNEQQLLADFHTASNPIAQTELIFREWRHPQAHTSEGQEWENKIRENVQQCLSWAQTTCTYAHDHASGTAAQDVSADLNAVQSTFQTIASAMQEINVVEKHPVVTPTAKESLVKVFIALLSFCSYVGTDLRKQTRLGTLLHLTFKTMTNHCSPTALWRKKVLRQQVDVTSKQCERVEQAIKKFHDAIRTESFNDTKEIKEGVHWLIKNTNTKMQQTVLLGNMYNMSEKGNVLDKLAKTLQNRLHLNLTVMSQMATRMDTIMQQLTEDGLRWFRESDPYQKWLYRHGTCPLLYLKGNDGVGKTFLTAHCYKLIPMMAGRNQTLVQKETVRQQLIVTYFLFEPGMQYSQTYAGVVASILFQIAAQDPKWCDSISTKPVLKSRDPKKIWDELVLKRFEKRSHSSEELYILLDGISDMQPKEREPLLKILYETLEQRNHRIWILLTGSREQRELFPAEIAGALPIPEIKITTDQRLIDKIIEKRMGDFENLSRIRPNSEGYRLIHEYLVQTSNGNLSILDQMIEILDQNGMEKKAFLKFMKDVGNSEDILIRNALAGSDAVFNKAVKKVLLWCAFAKQTLTVSNLSELLHLDDDLQVKSIRITDVLDRCRNLLYIRPMISPNLGPPSVDAELYWCSRPDHETEIPKDKSRKQPPASEYGYIEFRQTKFKECIREGGAALNMDMNFEKVEIFVTLCDVLCGSEEVTAESLHEYATFNLIRHLRDIDFVTQGKRQADRDLNEKNLKDKMSLTKDVKLTQSREIDNEQLKRVGEAVWRILTNGTGVSSVFEKVLSQMAASEIHFDLYDLSEFTTSTNELVRSWAEELIARDERENLSLPAHIWSWADNMKKQPESMLENLAKGHLQSWAQKSTAEEARIPYKLAYRACYTTGKYKHWSRDGDDINTRVAEDMLGQCRDSRTRFAQARLAAALLLYESPNKQERDYALFLYEMNRHLDDSMCAEKLYSLLGLAEHYVPSRGSFDAPTTNWTRVKEYAEEALKCWKDSDAALRPNFNAERCKSVYMLHAKACMALGDTKLARKTCQDALSNKFLRHSRALGYFLTVLVQIYADQEAHSSIIQTIQDQLENQPPYFIPAWLMNRSRQTNKDDRLRRAAVATGNVELVIQIYDRAICYWASRGLFHETCVMLSELAIIYRQDCHAIRMAEDILNRILEAMLKDEALQVDSKLLSIIIMERFDIYYDRYSKARNKTAKEPLCQAANALIADVRVADVIESSTKASVLITLAKMWRGIGFKYRAYEHADQAFKLCIADLEDWVDDNDMAAFRALTKVLHFAGLSKDAGISASLIFDRANANALQVSEEEYQNTLSSAIFGGERPRPLSVDGWMALKVDASASAHKDGPSIPQSPTSNFSTDRTNDETPTTAATTPCSGSIQESIVDEGNGSMLQCMGPCRKEKLSQWELDSSPWYLCLDCPSTDYCSECYNTRDAHRHSQAKGLWSKVCWGKHVLIQQPVSGWKGVKDGVIRVGTSSRGVKDWMMDMKERWGVEMKNNTKKPR
ncbi:hypothetical protein BO94DRAFT_607008 [Aspergillus sclerotioniger CBS 115572]|uniref:Nephrocystin 3-like N-terminal domain-containing protein n=1 Tax=Aspergillus sclerotioniger CBS 115572 TaxID=1450535 RepID=A0A317VKV4_9EURO|nr:hypothetical protein BO94DRAFT_607008 [Aspergillus sclerotioniger CBS 115572]PWY74525.1 hypothetical protein BO94DRAFT_607008 [Aspergillus sclerotioniger CBS 115572]